MPALAFTASTSPAARAAIDALHAVLALPPDRPPPRVFGMHCGTVGFLLNDLTARKGLLMRRLGEQTASSRVSVDGTLRLEEFRGASGHRDRLHGLHHSAHGPILPVGAGLRALTPISAMRPRRWPGALIPQTSVIHFEVMEPAKRPVSASADQRGSVSVGSVEISSAADRSIRLHFDPHRRCSSG